MDDELLSFLSGELELSPIFSQKKELSSVVELIVLFVQPCMESERMSHVSSLGCDGFASTYSTALGGGGAC